VNYVLDVGSTLGRIGQAVVTALAVALLAAAPAAWPWLSWRSGGQSRPTENVASVSARE
jgi:hypothetical protein